MNEKLITTNQLCDILGVSRMSIERYRKQRGLPYIRKGRSILFDMNEVEKWMENNFKIERFNYKDNKENTN